jgi:hypothetical protein
LEEEGGSATRSTRSTIERRLFLSSIAGRSIERRLGYDDTDLEVAGEAPERPRAERLLFDDLLRRHGLRGRGAGVGSTSARAAFLTAAAAAARDW